jgi:hypothetical protein
MRSPGKRSLAGLVAAGLVTLALTTTGATGAVASSSAANESGGKGIAHHAGAKPIRNLTKNAPVAELHRLGVNSAEPTVGVTQDGDVFTSAFQSNTRIEVMRSSNRGKSWDVVSPKLGSRNAQLLSLDPYTYVDLPRDDQDLSRVFTIDLTVACSYVSFTDDGGSSWITNPLVCGRPVNDHQTLFGGPPVTSTTIGYPNIIYYCWNDIASSSCQKSLDGGLTFTVTGSPVFPGENIENEEEGHYGVRGLCGGLHGHGFVDSKGLVYIPREYCREPWLAISRDEGLTWERVLVAKKVGAGNLGDVDPSVAVDKRGNIFYSWIGNDRLPYLATSKDGGKTWSKPMMIAPPGVNEANLPSIAVGGNGKVAIAYMGTENSPGKPFPTVECDAVQDQVGCPDPEEYEKTTWNGYTTVSANALAKDPVFYSNTVNNERDPFIRGACGPGRCKAVLDFIDVTIDRAGTVWSAWVDGCTAICATTGPSNIGSDGVIGSLRGGPSLR